MGPLVQLIELRGCTVTFEEIEERGALLRAQGLEGLAFCNNCATKSPGTAKELWELGVPVAAVHGGLVALQELPSDRKQRVIAAASQFPRVLVTLSEREAARRGRAIGELRKGAPQTRVIEDFSQVFSR